MTLERQNRSEFAFLGQPRTVIELESACEIQSGKEVARSIERLNSVITFYPNGVKRDWVLFDLHDGSLFSVVRYSEDGTVTQVIEEESKPSKIVSRTNADTMKPEDDHRIAVPTPEEVFEYDDVGNWIKSTVTTKMAGTAVVFVTRRLIHYYWGIPAVVLL